MNKADITPDLVARLVASQFPEWAGLPVVPVELDGWDNTTFRLGSTMSVRLPSAAGYVAQIEKEHRWLPVLGSQLPLRIPQPLARGVPALGFPHPWSVYRWVDGQTVNPQTVTDPVRGRPCSAPQCALPLRCLGRSGRRSALLQPWWARPGVGHANTRDARSAGIADRHGRRI